MTSRRVRTALLRLAAPFRRRHPVVLGGITEADRMLLTARTRPGWTGTASINGASWTDAAYRAERDPSDEAGA